jgi:hypothetical protein
MLIECREIARLNGYPKKLRYGFLENGTSIYYLIACAPVTA